MPSFQNGELLPKREIFQNEVATALKSTDESPKPQGKHVEHAPELYQVVVADSALDC
jgi:hypothetical protein